MEETNNTSTTALDRIANGENLQMIKASVPFLPPAIQKSLSLYVKVMEIQNIMSFYNSPLQACATDFAPHNTEEVLNELKKYASDSQQHSLDQILNMMHTMKMYQSYTELL